MKLFFAVLLSMISVSVTADNVNGFYVGAGAGALDIQDEEFEIGRPRTVEILGGYKYNNTWGGLELRMGKGISTGDGYTTYEVGSATLEGDIEREIGNYYSVYYRPELINDEAKLYALLGYTQIDYTESLLAADGTQVAVSETSDSGASYGIGVGFVLNPRFNFNIEYRNIMDGITNKPNFISANIDYRF